MPISGLIPPMRPQIYMPETVHHPEIGRENGRTIIRYPPVDLRPNETVRLGLVALLTAREEREATACEWRATATNVSGAASAPCPSRRRHWRVTFTCRRTPSWTTSSELAAS